VSECRIIVDPIYSDLWTFVDIINTPPRWKNAEFGEHRSIETEKMQLDLDEVAAESLFEIALKKMKEKGKNLS